MAVWKKHPILYRRFSFALWGACGSPSVSAFPPAARPRPICPSASTYHSYFSTPPETDELWPCPAFGSAPQWLHQQSMENQGPTFSTLATLQPEGIEIDICNLKHVNRGAYDKELWLWEVLRGWWKVSIYARETNFILIIIRAQSESCIRNKQWKWICKISCLLKFLQSLWKR